MSVQVRDTIHLSVTWCIIASNPTYLCTYFSDRTIYALLTPSATVNRCSVLTTELACLCCAKSHLKNFSWESWHKTTFIAATHHIDEQVMTYMYISYLMYTYMYLHSNFCIFACINNTKILRGLEQSTANCQSRI